MQDLRGKRALVTGAASGIGRAIAERLAREGARLALLDKNDAQLTRMNATTLGADSDPLRLVCDLCDHRQIGLAVADLLQHWHGLDILINNAGVVYCGPSHEMTQDDWQRILGVNLWGPVELTRRLLPHLLAEPEAHIVNVSSVYGHLATNRCTAYHLTKFGLVGFSEALRAEYARTRLGVTALCPGFVETGLFASMDDGRGRVRTPPSWICTTAEHVAAMAIRAIHRNQRMVLAGWFARLVYLVRRVSPGFFDRLYHLRRPGFLKRRPAASTRRVLDTSP